MVKLAEIGVLCECGADRFAPTGPWKNGEVCICAACARTFRVAASLERVPWVTVKHTLAERPHDLRAFEATWNAVPEAMRHSGPGAYGSATIEPVSGVIGTNVQDFLADRAGRFDRAERWAVALFVAVVVLAIFLILKAVP